MKNRHEVELFRHDDEHGTRWYFKYGKGESLEFENRYEAFAEALPAFAAMNRLDAEEQATARALVNFDSDIPDGNEIIFDGPDGRTIIHFN